MCSAIKSYFIRIILFGVRPSCHCHLHDTLRLESFVADSEKERSVN